MDKPKPAKKAYKDALLNSSKYDATASFSSTKRRLGDGSAGTRPEDETDNKGPIRDVGALTKAGDSLKENPYLSGFLALLSAIILSLAGYVFQMNGDMSGLSSELNTLTKTVDSIKGDYVNDKELTDKLEGIKEHIRLIENNIFFVGK